MLLLTTMNVPKEEEILLIWLCGNVRCIATGKRAVDIGGEGGNGKGRVRVMNCC